MDTTAARLSTAEDLAPLLHLIDRLICDDAGSISPEQWVALGLVPGADAPGAADCMEAEAWQYLLRHLALRKPEAAVTLLLFNRYPIWSATVAAGVARLTETDWIAALIRLTGGTDSFRCAAELALILAACLHRAWVLTLQHAELRPMFRRQLANFQHVQFRLLELSELAARAERAAACLVATPEDQTPLSELLDLCAALCNESQQICGGSGYLRETAFAETIVWIGGCETVLSHLAVSAAARF
jgi:hypothetical protein